jgi:hypothetical protein
LPEPEQSRAVAPGKFDNEGQMAAQIGIPADASTEQLHIIIGTLYLSLANAMEHIAAAESLSSAVAFKDQLLTALKSGDIDMSLLDDAKTFDLVISIVESALKLKSGNG